MTSEDPTEGFRRPDLVSRPTLNQTLAVAMRALRDSGPLISMYPSPENFEVADQGQRAQVIAWSAVFVYTRSDGFGGLGGYGWIAVPRNPIPSFSQMLGMGYS